MASVYVSGPVAREGGELPRWVRATYEQAYERIGSFHAEAVMPYADMRAEKMEPGIFYREIERRISSADAVIVVFTGQDVSAGIEAAIASLHGKKAMIVSDDLKRAPRLLRGLPNVISSVEFSTKESVSSALIAFLQATLSGSARGITASH